VFASSTIGNPYLFTGRRYDAETSWYHYRTRYLDPAAGRFTTRDVIGIWGDPGEFGNGYAYVGGSPLSWLDPWGLAKIIIYVEDGNAGGSSGGDSSKRGYGHAWIDVVDDDGKRTGAGFYPGGGGAGKEATDGRQYPGDYADDTKTKHDYDESFEFDVCQEKADKAKKEMKKHKKDKTKWSLNHNCTSFVCQTAEKADIKIDKSKIKTWGWDDPAKLLEYLKKLKEEEKKKSADSNSSNTPKTPEVPQWPGPPSH
jgi:RHS repeat-associated protein